MWDIIIKYIGTLVCEHYENVTNLLMWPIFINHFGVFLYKIPSMLIPLSLTNAQLLYDIHDSIIAQDLEKLLKADRPHLRNYSHTPTGYRHK